MFLNVGRWACRLNAKDDRTLRGATVDPSTRAAVRKSASELASDANTDERSIRGIIFQPTCSRAE
jgi:hypothetical protein